MPLPSRSQAYTPSRHDGRALLSGNGHGEATGRRDRHDALDGEEGRLDSVHRFGSPLTSDKTWC